MAGRTLAAAAVKQPDAAVTLADATTGAPAALAASATTWLHRLDGSQRDCFTQFN